MSSIFAYIRYDNHIKRMQLNSQNMIKLYPPHRVRPFGSMHFNKATVKYTRTFKYLVMLFLILVGTTNRLWSQTQATLLFESAAQQGVQEAFYKNNITKSANNFIYTAGASLNASGNYDIIVTKHSQANVEIWTQVWANANYDGLDMAADLAIDSNGDIILVGSTQLSLTDYDAVVLKYNSSGTLMWSQTIGGSLAGPDGFTTVAVSGTDIYCGGSILNTILQQHDALAAKYNGAGILQWNHVYNSANNLREGHNKIAFNGSNVVFYGGVQTAASPITWTLVRLDFAGSTGALVYSNLSYNISTNFTKINDIDIDTQDHIYIAGYLDTPQGRDIKVVKLLSMAVAWTYQFDGADHLDDEAHCIEVNGSHVYAAGYTTSAAQGKDLFLVKIPAAGPPITWQKIIDEAQGDDEFTALNINASGHLYLAGHATHYANHDLCVYNFHYVSGNLLGKADYNNPYNGSDYATGIAIDEQGNVFVAGQMEVAPNSYKYNLVKWAQKTLYMPVVSHSSSGGYVANVSQLRNPDGTANQRVLYYNRDNRVATYLDDAKLSYQLVQSADTSNADTTYRVDMRFTKGSTTQKVYAYDQRREYHNYYLAHMLHKGERTPVYNSVWKNNVYTNTDILYTNGPSGFKQYIIARVGAPTGDFELTFDGQNGLLVNPSGQLVIQTSIGDIVYAKPKVYNMNGSTGALTLLSWQPNYVINANKVSFAGIGAWGGILVLELGEPSISSSSQQLENVDWSTMFGGIGQECFEGCVANTSDQVYSVGSQNGVYIIENVGQVIGAPTSTFDAFLVKFDANCVALYISYYGGSVGNDEFEKIDWLRTTDQLHIVGNTSSSDLDLIDTIEMDDTTLGGNQDGIYAKFSSDGFLLFHTYVGGDGVDELVDIKVAYSPDLIPIIYYVGNTESGEGWPNFQNNPANESMNYSGGKDGFYIRRMGELEEQDHMSFFGSSNDDIFVALDLFKGTPVILGRTNGSVYSSTDGALPTDGLFPKAHLPYWNSDFISNNGTATFNYFITHFGNPDQGVQNYNNAFKWCTYIAPCPSFVSVSGLFPVALGDIVVGPHDDNLGDNAFVYVTGGAPLPNNGTDLEFPLIDYGWHQSQPSGGAFDAFLLQWNQLSNSSDQIWGTLFGGDGNDFGRGLATDNEGNLFICGNATINTIAATSDWCETPDAGDFPMCDHNGLLYTETDIANASDRAFIAAFPKNGEMLWSTQYGNGDGNSAIDICVNSQLVWIVGNSTKDWTFVEYNQTLESDDYFRNVDPDDAGQQEATIARFDIPLIVNTPEVFTNMDTDIDLYPNPNNGEFILTTTNLDFNGTKELSIYNMLGELVYHSTISQDQKLLDLKEIANGCYQVVLHGDGFSSTAKWIKQ
jgi:Secretion system C-terminal sorting domain/Beta-propeller repeat